MYDADDERVWSFQPPVNGLARFDRWTLRGLDGKVRRLVELYGDNWTNAWGGSNLWEDYIYRDGTLLAAYMSNLQQHHMDVDHLGTPRLITNAGGGQPTYHVYLPYGVEATPFNQDQERMKFTGHERDLADPTSPADDLDYMHARFTNPTTGRFLTIDPSPSAKTQNPQSWNLYAYTWNNPLRYLDSNGREIGDFSTPPSQRTYPTASQAASDVLFVAGAGYAAVGGSALLASAEGITAGASGLGEALTLVGAKFQSAISFVRNLAAAFTDAPTIKEPFSGDLERTFSTATGAINILANASTEGSTLILSDAAVYGDKAKAVLGVTAIRDALGQLGAEAQAKGYTSLVISGLRYSGAKPGQTQTIVLDLSKGGAQ